MRVWPENSLQFVTFTWSFQFSLTGIHKLQGLFSKSCCLSVVPTKSPLDPRNSQQKTHTWQFFLRGTWDSPVWVSKASRCLEDIRIWPILPQIDTKWMNNLDHSSKWHLLLTEYASLTWAAPNLAHFLFYSLLSFIIPFATLSRSGYVSFAASMCLKFTSASFRGKLLKSKPCFHVIKLARHSQWIPMAMGICLGRWCRALPFWSWSGRQGDAFIQHGNQHCIAGLSMSYQSAMTGVLFFQRTLALVAIGDIHMYTFYIVCQVAPGPPMNQWIGNKTNERMNDLKDGWMDRWVSYCSLLSYFFSGRPLRWGTSSLSYLLFWELLVILSSHLSGLLLLWAASQLALL